MFYFYNVVVVGFEYSIYGMVDGLFDFGLLVDIIIKICDVTLFVVFFGGL